MVILLYWLLTVGVALFILFEWAGFLVYYSVCYNSIHKPACVSYTYVCVFMCVYTPRGDLPIYRGPHSFPARPNIKWKLPVRFIYSYLVYFLAIFTLKAITNTRFPLLLTGITFGRCFWKKWVLISLSLKIKSKTGLWLIQGLFVIEWITPELKVYNHSQLVP